MTRAFTQPNAVYYQCGAMPLQVEFLCSRPGENELTFDMILDIGLCIIETMEMSSDSGRRCVVIWLGKDKASLSSHQQRSIR